MNALFCYKKFWTNYFNFYGRSGRAEFWWAWGINFVLRILLDVLFVMAPQTGISMTIFAWATLIPTVSLWMRRLHDIGKSGWFVLLMFVPLVGPIFLIYWACMDGVQWSNAYGNVPSVEKRI